MTGSSARLDLVARAASTPGPRARAARRAARGGRARLALTHARFRTSTAYAKPSAAGRRGSGRGARGTGRTDGNASRLKYGNWSTSGPRRSPQPRHHVQELRRAPRTWRRGRGRARASGISPSPAVDDRRAGTSRESRNARRRLLDPAPRPRAAAARRSTSRPPRPCRTPARSGGGTRPAACRAGRRARPSPRAENEEVPNRTSASGAYGTGTRAGAPGLHAARPTLCRAVRRSATPARVSSASRRRRRRSRRSRP